MGSCHATNKPIKTLKQPKKRVIAASAPVSPSHTHSKTIFSQTKLNETLKREVNGCPNQLLRLHKVPLSQHYSVIYEKVPSKPLNLNQAFVQNNFNGKIRIVETLPKSVPEHTEYIQKLITYNFNHPNIIKVFDIYEDSDSYKIIFENYQGCILKSLGQGLLEDNAAIIIKQMIDILYHIHSLKLVHGNLQLGSFAINDRSEHLTIQLIDIKSIFIKEPISILNIPYLAPEALRDPKNKSKQRDVWSLGVMAHQLLTGYLPFKGDTIQKVSAEIRRGVIDMTSIQFDKLSPAAKEFLSNILVLSPLNRMDLVSLNKTNWMLRQKKKLEIKIKSDLQNMRKIKRLSVLQYCFLQHMANQYQNEQTTQMFQTFNDIDQNKDGKITKYELMSAYQKLYDNEGDAFQFVSEIFLAVDHDSNGEIEISEYILALIDRKSIITEENLKVTFTQLSNKKGFITPNSLTQYFNMKEELIEAELTKMQKKYLNYNDFKLCMSELLS